MNISIRFKIIFPLFILIAAIFIVLIYGNYKNGVQMQLDQEQREYDLVAQRINADLENIFNQARLGLEAVAENPEVQKAFAERDRERLLALTMPVFEKASGEGIEQFQFHLPPATSFLRLHMPDKFGDDLSSFRNTVLECNRTQKPVQGLEEGRGGFGFRVVLPVFYQGRHVGSVEYGPGLNAGLLEKWKSQMGGEYYLYSKGRTGVALENNQDGLLVSTAKADRVALSEQSVDQIMHTGKPATLLLDQSRKAALIIPLADYSGKYIGYLKVVRDRSAIIQKLQSDLHGTIIKALVALLVLLGSTFITVTVLTGPLIKLSSAVEAVARGDLTKKVETLDSRDEIGVLAQSCRKMTDNLQVMIADIQRNASKLAGYSQELASSSQEVTASMEEVAGAVDEFAAVSARGLANAENAVRESEKVKMIAGEGNQAVRETIDKINSIAGATANISSAVQKLSEQSNRIGEIIVTITGIADQTSLLALNAAIEAARAGEQGRGFAVVAEEVRRLAEQSARAAGEITGLVEAIQSGVGDVITAMERGGREVDEGVGVAQSAGASLEQIIEAVDKNTVMIGAIAADVRRASESTRQLAAASEQTASSMQQVSAAAQELSRIAGELEQSSGQFVLSNG